MLVCPSIVEYSDATQDEAEAEYKLLPEGSALREFIRDYSQLRDTIRVCKGV